MSGSSGWSLVVSSIALSSLLMGTVVGCVGRVDRFVVRSAQLVVAGDVAPAVERARISHPPDWRLPLMAHGIAEGDGVVLSKRQYHPGRIDVTDHEHFAKLSILVPPFDSDGVFDVERDHLEVVYT